MKETNLLVEFQKQPENNPGNRVLDEPAVYEFMVAQSLSGQWAVWFDDLDLMSDNQGNTRIHGIIVDQAALHGVLTKIRDLNLILLSVMRK